MSLEDLKKFQQIYGEEDYQLDNSPVARWIVEHGFTPEKTDTKDKAASPSGELREKIADACGKPAKSLPSKRPS